MNQTPEMQAISDRERAMLRHVLATLKLRVPAELNAPLNGQLGRLLGKEECFMKCSICKTEVGINGIRLGVCWNCAEAESIIAEGLDMHDQSLHGNKPAKTPMEKVQLLLARGWHFGARAA